MEWEELVLQTMLKIGNNSKAFYNFMMERQPLGYENDALLWGRCFKIWDDINNKDTDHLTVVAGDEGTGKSTLCARACSIVSFKQFYMRHICYNLLDLVRAVKQSTKGDSIQIDEGALVLFMADANTQEGRYTQKMLTVIREKNLHLAICIPNFFQILKTPREYRVATLLQIKKRGNYVGFNKRAIPYICKKGIANKRVFVDGLKEGTFWQGYFNKSFVEINDVNFETYKINKTQNVDNFLNEIEEYAITKDEKSHITIHEFGERVGLSAVTIKRRIDDGTIPATKFGGKWLIRKDFDLDKD